MKSIIISTIIITVGVIVSTIGDILLKESELHKSVPLILGIALYACGAFPVAIAFTRIQFGSVFLVWEAITILVALIIARFAFHEPLTSARAGAFVLAISALVLSYR